VSNYTEKELKIILKYVEEYEEKKGNNMWNIPGEYVLHNLIEHIKENIKK